jgi:hypothetical protein
MVARAPADLPEMAAIVRGDLTDAVAVVPRTAKAGRPVPSGRMQITRLRKWL